MNTKPQLLKDFPSDCRDHEALESPRPLVVLFVAQDCAESGKAAETVKQLAASYEGRLNFASVNIARDNELVKRYRVDYTPSLVILWNGQVLYQAMGTLPAGELRWMFEAAGRHNADLTTVAEPQSSSKKNILCNE